MTDVLHLVRASVLIFQGISADFPSFSLITQPTTTIPPLQTRPTPLHTLHASVFVSGPSPGSVFQPTSPRWSLTLQPTTNIPPPRHGRRLCTSCTRRFLSLDLTPARSLDFQTCGIAFFPVTERSKSLQHEFECSSPPGRDGSRNVAGTMLSARWCDGTMAWA